MVAIGMAETGAANGTVKIGGIRTVNGLGGMATSGVITRLMSSLLAISDFHGGGAGAGARGLDGAGAMTMATPTVTTGAAMDTPATDTVTTDTGTAMDMAMAAAADTVLPPGRK